MKFELKIWKKDKYICIEYNLPIIGEYMSV